MSIMSFSRRLAFGLPAGARTPGATHAAHPRSPTITPAPPRAHRTQAGSCIVEALRTYKPPVFVYIPCNAELR